MERTRDGRSDGWRVWGYMRAGQAMTELALLLPLLILIFIGVLDLGRAFHDHVAVSNAARVGVLYAQQVTDPATGNPITVQQIITQVTSEPQGGIDSSKMRVTVCVPAQCYPYPNAPGTAPYTNTLAYGEPISITVAISFTPITPLVHLTTVSGAVYGSTFAWTAPLNAAVLPAEQTAAAAAINHFKVTTSPTSVVSGTTGTDPFTVTITALNVNGNVITNYSSPSVSVTPISGTLVGTTTCATFTNGVCNLPNVTLTGVPIPSTQNAASVTLTASDNGSPAHTGTGTITVYKPVAQFDVATSPTSVQQVSGVTDPFNVTVTALDADRNVVTNYSSSSVTVTPISGTLSTTSCAAFSSGVCTLSGVQLTGALATNQNAGNVALTASDNGSPAHTGTTDPDHNLGVYKPLATLQLASVPASGFTLANGGTITLTVAAKDADGNLMTTPVSVNFTSSGNKVTLTVTPPVPATFSNGTYSTSATLANSSSKAQSVSIQATSGSITSNSVSGTVNP